MKQRRIWYTHVPLKLPIVKGFLVFFSFILQITFIPHLSPPPQPHPHPHPYRSSPSPLHRPTPLCVFQTLIHVSFCVFDLQPEAINRII